MLGTVRRVAGAALAAAMVFMLPVTANATEAQDTRPAYEATLMGDSGNLVGDTHGEQSNAPAPSDKGRAAFQVPAWSYHITASCSGYESAIRQGANYWGSGTETASSGTPVSCVGGYVSGCGGGNVVGCNWGMGDRITLSTMVNDFALLSAHEFGHNWYGHSGSGCADWSSASAVMRTTMC
ncbi:hypothetical protein N566_01625 [Streptomycetaceae bacterium MP113-05]|nr:hypothetical protein N566_01625 [Streptomycetaceae bacterium MP113-05]